MSSMSSAGGLSVFFLPAAVRDMLYSADGVAWLVTSPLVRARQPSQSQLQSRPGSALGLTASWAERLSVSGWVMQCWTWL